MTSERGTSMIELVVVMALLALVAVMGSDAMLSTLRASSTVQDRSAAIADARGAVDLLARDIRAANPLTAMSSSSITVSITCSAAGVGDCAATNLRSVTYAVTGTQLQRTQAGATSTVLARAVRNPGDRPVFTYLDRNGNATATPRCVQQVGITLVVAAESDAHTVDVATSVTLRNATAVAGC